MHLYIFISGGNSKLLSLHSLPSTKDTLSDKALTLSTANMPDVFKHLGMHSYVSTMNDSSGTQQDTI